MSLIANSESSLLSTTGPADWPLLLALASAVALLHLLTNGRYGFHRDELQFLSDARHLDWGFVAYPPLTPSSSTSAWRSSASRSLAFGSSPYRQAAGAYRHRSHGQGAWRRPPCAIHCSSRRRSLPGPALQRNRISIHLFRFPVVGADRFFVVRLLSEDPRWWIAIGAVLGLGLLTKYSIVFYIAGILAGVCSPLRAASQVHLVLGRHRPGARYVSSQLSLARHTTSSPTNFCSAIHTRDVRDWPR